MKFLPCRCALIRLLLISCFIPAAWAQNGNRIQKIVIRHVGPPAVLTDTGDFDVVRAAIYDFVAVMHRRGPLGARWDAAGVG